MLSFNAMSENLKRFRLAFFSRYRQKEAEYRKRRPLWATGLSKKLPRQLPKFKLQMKKSLCGVHRQTLFSGIKRIIRF